MASSVLTTDAEVRSRTSRSRAWVIPVGQPGHLVPERRLGLEPAEELAVLEDLVSREGHVDDRAVVRGRQAVGDDRGECRRRDVDLGRGDLGVGLEHPDERGRRADRARDRGQLRDYGRDRLDQDGNRGGDDREGE